MFRVRGVRRDRDWFQDDIVLFCLLPYNLAGHSSFAGSNWRRRMIYFDVAFFYFS